MERLEVQLKIMDSAEFAGWVDHVGRQVRALKRLALLLFVLGISLGLLVGCASPQEIDGPVRYECDMGHQVIRVIPDPKAPRSKPVLLPFNPCGFKT